jgi:hypothetical protein
MNRMVYDPVSVSAIHLLFTDLDCVLGGGGGGRQLVFIRYVSTCCAPFDQTKKHSGRVIIYLKETAIQ